MLQIVRHVFPFNEKRFYRHMVSHQNSNGVGFKCSYCSASFSTKSVLSVHLRDAHGQAHVEKRKNEIQVFKTRSCQRQNYALNFDLLTFIEIPLTHTQAIKQQVVTQMAQGNPVVNGGANNTQNETPAVSASLQESMQIDENQVSLM